MDPRLVLATTEAKLAAQKETILKDKIIAAMESTMDHWLLTEEEMRFKAAIGGAILACDSEEDRNKLQNEMNALNAMSAAMTGVPVDFTLVDFPENPIGLLELWGEVKEKKGMK